jgi:hypothetical protein
VFSTIMAAPTTGDNKAKGYAIGLAWG